jgi:hypothetical protein
VNTPRNQKASNKRRRILMRSLKLKLQKIELAKVIEGTSR